MVRRLTPEDARAYAALRQAMLVDTPWAFSASPESEVGSVAERVVESLGRPGFAIVGAFEPEGLLAVAGLDREKKPKRAHVAWIWGVYTLSAARGRGLGRAVMDGAIQEACSWAGVARVQLSVSERSREARALYESLGFESWGVEPDALRVDGRAYQETHMSLSIGGR